MEHSYDLVSKSQERLNHGRLNVQDTVNILKTKIVFSLNIGFNEETIPFCTVKTFLACIILSVIIFY